MKSAAYKYKDIKEEFELREFISSRGYVKFKYKNSFQAVYIIINSNFRKGEWCLAEDWNIVKDSNRVPCATKEEFMKLANELAPNPKPIESDLPQTFAITGKPHQLASIYQDLLDLGYVKTTPRPFKDWIGLNFSKISKHSKLEYYRPFYINDNLKLQENINYEVIFNLPQDYSKALEFAQKMINHSFWDKNATRKKEIDFEIAELTKDLELLNKEVDDVNHKISTLANEKAFL